MGTHLVVELEGYIYALLLILAVTVASYIAVFAIQSKSCPVLAGTLNL
jgi:hypothetical protein